MADAFKPASHQEELDRAFIEGQMLGREDALDTFLKEVGLPREEVVQDTALRTEYIATLREAHRKAWFRFMDSKPDDSFRYIPSEPAKAAASKERRLSKRKIAFVFIAHYAVLALAAYFAYQAIN